MATLTLSDSDDDDVEEEKNPHGKTVIFEIRVLMKCSALYAVKCHTNEI